MHTPSSRSTISGSTNWQSQWLDFINKDLIFTATSATPTAESIPVHYNDQVTRYPQPQLK